MEKGYLLLVLHAHLPFIRHPEYPSFLEENWYFEALTETYLPFIDMFERLANERVDFRLTMTLTPSLLSMMTDPLLSERYVKRLDLLIELAQKEIQRTQGDSRFNRLAHMYHDHFQKMRHLFNDRYGRQIHLAFKKFQEAGFLDIITCGATHGYFPNMQTVPSSVRAQVKIATDHYKSLFSRPPRGIWLPECGFAPGVDSILRDNGLRYFFAEAHAILHGSSRPKYGVFAPVYCPTGVACFARDSASSKQVWSAAEGYPGDNDYREFYRDIGFDLDMDYIRPYIQSDGVRTNTGIKYYRITGSDQKEPYDPDRGRQKAAEHAGNFMFNREKQIEYLATKIDRKPLIVSPYDAELFGHWWFEGPQFIEFLIRKIYFDSQVIRLITAEEYLIENPINQTLTPGFSSWGYKGYSEVWLDGANDWIYRHLHEASARMQEMARRFPSASGVLERALKQAARELFLAEASDWAFIMKNETAVEYARRRVRDHIERFTRLYEEITQNRIDEGWLSEIEGKDNLFPNLDYHVYA